MDDNLNNNDEIGKINVDSDFHSFDSYLKNKEIVLQNMEGITYLSRIFSRLKNIYDETNSISKCIAAYFLHVQNFRQVHILQHENSPAILVSTNLDVLSISLNKHFNIVLQAINSFPDEFIMVCDAPIENGMDGINETNNTTDNDSPSLVYYILILIAKIETYLKNKGFSYAPKLDTLIPSVKIRNLDKHINKLAF